MQHLLGVGERQRQFSSAVILVAADVVLSDLAIVEQEDLRGMVLASGGVTSHASILAKSLEIPTVVGTEHAEEVIREGDQLIVDGNSGVVFVNPTADLVREYERLKRDYRAFNRDLEALRDLPAETVDGHVVDLVGQHRPARRHEPGALARRRGDRLVSHRGPVPLASRFSHRAGASRSV